MQRIIFALEITLVIVLAVLPGDFATAQSISRWVVSNGGQFSENNSYSLSWTLGECYVSTLDTSGYILSQGFHQPEQSKFIAGTLFYDNSLATPLNAETVFLHDITGNTVDSVITGPSGSFFLRGTISDTCAITPLINHVWGGGNSQDALEAMKHFVGITQLKGLQKEAADVDLSGFVNSVDAMNIAKRFVGMINSFPSGDWVMRSDTIDPGMFPVSSKEIPVLCYGDINRDFIPGKKLSFNKPPATNFVNANPGAVFPFPVIARSKGTIYSLSMRLFFGNSGFRLVDKKQSTEKGNWFFNQNGSNISIAFYNLEPVSFSPGDTLFTLLLLADQVEFNNILIPENHCIFYDFHEELPGFTIDYPAIVSTGSMDNELEVFPVPCNSIVYLHWNSDLIDMKSICLYTPSGNQVFCLHEPDVSASGNGITIDVKNLTPGVYFLKAAANNGINDLFFVKRIPVIH